MTKYLALSGALLMLASLAGCRLDEPVIPAEELYIRGFIKKYGLIDPTQDFSSAMQTTVKLNLREKASVVNVYAQMGDDLYRVGCFAELQGAVELPVDVSEATETILVDIDGVRYYTTPGGSVDVKSRASGVASRAGERALPDNYDIRKLWIDPAEWAAKTTSNGETGQEYASKARKPVYINSKGKISDVDDGPDAKDPSSIDYFDVTTMGHIGENLVSRGQETSFVDSREVGNTSTGANLRFLIKNNDAALSAYRFTFRTASRNDGNVRVVILGQQQDGSNEKGLYVFLDSKNLEVEGKVGRNEVLKTTIEGKYTEWELRTELMPRGYYELIIMGVDSKPNFDGEQTCGNWGYMSMERLKTAKDMKWILACEDLGTTDDFDFNDVVFSIAVVNTNNAAIRLGVIQWQVVDNPNEEGTVIRPQNAPASRDGDTEGGDYKTRVEVQALAAGGTLPIWLHFREEEETNASGLVTGTDYLVCPGFDDGYRGCLKKVDTRASIEADNEKNGDGIATCSEWHRWFGYNNSATMLNTGTTPHVSNPKSVIFYTKNVFSLENFCYLKFKTNENEDLPYYFDNDTNLDPWAAKVLKWQWQQNHSQEVTFGFFLTVYKPTVSGSGSEIDEKDPTANTNNAIHGKNENESHILSKSLEGLPPQMFLIPDCDPMTDTGTVTAKDGWRWPCERVDITEVYPNFNAWVKDAYEYYGMNWFMLPKTGFANENRKFYPRNPDAQGAYQPFDPSGSSDN